MDNQSPPSPPHFYLIGAAVGLAIGIVAGHLYKQAYEENPPEATVPSRMTVMNMLKVGAAIMGVVRMIAEIGKGNDK